VLLFLLGQIDLRFADETAFTLQPNVPYGWIRTGIQRGIPSRKGGNLNVFGLMNLQGELTSYQTTQSVNSQMVIDWLDDFASTIEKMTVVILDNAPWHISGSVEEKIEEWEEKGLFIFRLPTYSPHLNIIETLWRKMKNEWLKPQDYENKHSLHRAVNIILSNYNNDEFNIDFSLNISC
jgi:transposase